MLTRVFSRKISTAVLTALFLCAFCFSRAASAQSESGKEIYTQLKAFGLTGGSREVSNLVLVRDRAVMTFTSGTFYFAAPVAGKVEGAVFVGQGTFRADVPPSEFEKSNVKRLLDADVVQSDFKTAVLRFSDDTFDIIGKDKGANGAGFAQAQKLASELEPRILKETGANLSARIALSIVNRETPGVFYANFDGGRLDRFSFLFDPQTRTPTHAFDINAGEKGIIFAHKSAIYDNEIWLAFYGADDYKSGTVSYSDINDLVDIEAYKMNVDLRTPKSRLGVSADVSMQTLAPNLRAIPFSVGGGLSEYQDERLKKQMRLKAVRLGGKAVDFVQEDWESGYTVFLPEATGAKNQKIELEFDLEGDFMQQPEIAQTGAVMPTTSKCFYPASTTDWYPQHGYLDRATYEITFRHQKNLKVATVGTRLSETPDPEDKNLAVTRYQMTSPISLATFALGPFERHADTVKFENGDQSAPIPLEFNSLPGGVRQIKEDFILAELNNSVRYFHALFGKYPYDTFSATFHPYGFGQGFPSMLMIPDTDRADKYTYSFISHETAHQWWGNVVAWRSYRDQWLSEGFAEYSGVLYTSLRQNPKAALHLVDEMRDSLKLPPRTASEGLGMGRGKGRLEDVGPIILGHRLDTSKTYGAYQALIYNKGALVLRMIHFLLTNPANGDDKEFYAMMKDFVERYRNKVASTDDFRIVAGEHFAKTPIAQRYKLTDLNWFFKQYVYQTELPAYKLEYQFQDQSDGSVLFTGTLAQENVPEKWFMALPVVFTFGENKFASGTLPALGAKTPFSIKLPARPTRVELDPYKWVLSEKTE